MFKKSHSNLVHLILFASLISSVHLVSATSWQDGISSRKSFDSVSDKSTERPEDENEFKSYFQIRSEIGSKLALGISESHAGAILTLEDPNKTESQQWYIDSDGWTIRSKLYDTCLSSNGPYPAFVTWGPCDRTGSQFVQTANNQIKMYKDDVCLDISAGNDTLGGYVMAKKCIYENSKRLNQKWSFNIFTKTTEKLIVFRNQMSSGKVLDASKKNGSPTGGTGVIVNDYNKNAITQKWYTSADGIIRSAFNDYCLVSNGDYLRDYPALVTVELCDSRRDNKWVYHPYDQRIKLATNAVWPDTKCLHLIGKGSKQIHVLAGNVTEFSCQDLSNQKWTLENDDAMV